jgi:hypothetical protein
MTTETASKASEWVECNLIMENLKVKEMTGKETLIEVPFSFDIGTIEAFRQSVDDEGYPEDYTVVYTDFGASYCIDISYGEFNYMHKKFRDGNKTV